MKDGCAAIAAIYRSNPLPFFCKMQAPVMSSTVTVSENSDGPGLPITSNDPLNIDAD